MKGCRRSHSSGEAWWAAETRRPAWCCYLGTAWGFLVERTWNIFPEIGGTGKEKAQCQHLTWWVLKMVVSWGCPWGKGGWQQREKRSPHSPRWGGLGYVSLPDLSDTTQNGKDPVLLKEPCPRGMLFREPWEKLTEVRPKAHHQCPWQGRWEAPRAGSEFLWRAQQCYSS